MTGTTITSTVDSHCYTSLCDPWCSAALTRPSGRFQTPAWLFVSPAPSPFKMEEHHLSTWSETNVSTTKIVTSHLHSGDRRFLFKPLLVLCRSALSGGFTGQQGEFAVAVVHQVQNGVVASLTWVLQSSAKNLSAQCSLQSNLSVISSF